MFTARRKKNDCEDVSPELQYPELRYALLFLAAEVGDLTGVKAAIDCGADPNIQDKVGNTPLHDAAKSGSPDVVKLLLEHGADPNIQNKVGNTPLHYAAKYSWLNVALRHDPLEVVKLLLEHGADPNARDKDGKTPLHYAAEFCHVDVARALLDYGADPTIRDSEGRTPLDVGDKCPEEFREMLRRGGGRTTVYE
jgi:cytohesin